MKGKIRETQDKSKKDYSKKLNKILPGEFKVVELIVKGKKIIADMKEIMQIANCESKAEIISSMNKVSTYYFYFGRVEVDLDEELNKSQEEFDIWFAEKKSEFNKEGSEKGKERCVMTHYSTDYKIKKKNIETLTRYKRYAEIARKSLDRNIGLIQSIGAMVREGNKGGINMPSDGTDEF